MFLDKNDDYFPMEYVKTSVIEDFDSMEKNKDDYSKKILKNTPNMVCRLNPNGKTLRINPAFEKITGYSEKEILGLDWWKKIADPSEKEEVIRLKRTFQKKDVKDSILKIRTKKGKTRYLAIFSINEYLEDKLDTIVFVGNDITKRKNAEKKLIESEERYRTLFEQAAECISIINADDGDIVEFNDQTSRLFGYTREEFSQLKVHNLVIAEKKELVAILQNIKKQKEDKFEIKVLTRDGDIKYAFVRCRVIHIKDDKYVQIILHDITELKNIQRRLEKTGEIALENNKAKSMFLANMSHEIRTPMNGVIGMAGILLETKLDTRQREYAEIIMKSANSLMVIINDILDISKIEAGKLEIEKYTFDIKDLIDDVNKILKIKIQSKELELIIQVDEQVPDLVVGDPVRIRQVLINLLGNAVKFTEKGTITIRVVTDEKSENEVVICFYIEDTGIGVSEKDINYLFKPFSQKNSSTNREYGGTGLGLAISKNIVEMMNGQIGARQNNGNGSVFWFKLKFKIGRKPFAGKIDKIQNKPVPVESNHFETETNGDRSIEILLVEDNVVNQKLVEIMISKMLNTLFIAGNGLEALELLKKKKFDLILMDIQMPRMDGYELTSIIRDSNSDVLDHNVPIIAMTAHAREDDKVRCLDAGMNDYISKPIDPFRFRNLIKKVDKRHDQNC